MSTFLPTNFPEIENPSSYPNYTTQNTVYNYDHHSQFEPWDDHLSFADLPAEDSTSTFTAQEITSTESSFNSIDGLPRSTHMHVKYNNRMKREKTGRGFRIAFRVKTELENMDDGFKWRKYGRKMLKNNPNPRNYYRCSVEGCNVKKQVEREKEDSSYVITSYEGVHNHQSPCVHTSGRTLQDSYVSSRGII